MRISDDFLKQLQTVAVSYQDGGVLTFIDIYDGSLFRSYVMPAYGEGGRRVGHFLKFLQGISKMQSGQKEVHLVALIDALFASSSTILTAMVSDLILKTQHVESIVWVNNFYVSMSESDQIIYAAEKRKYSAFVNEPGLLTRVGAAVSGLFSKSKKRSAIDPGPSGSLSSLKKSCNNI